MIPDYEERLDQLFTTAFGTNDAPMLDWVKVKLDLKELRLTSERLKPVEESLERSLKKLEELEKKISSGGCFNLLCYAEKLQNAKRLAELEKEK